LGGQEDVGIERLVDQWPGRRFAEGAADIGQADTPINRSHLPVRSRNRPKVRVEVLKQLPSCAH
jgi:hypothetical protein